MPQAKEPAIKMYAYMYEPETDTYNIANKAIHTFKNMKEFETISGVYAMIYFMQHPYKNLGFCYCERGQDIKENMQIAKYGFMEEE